MNLTLPITLAYSSAVTNQPFLLAETLLMADGLRQGQSWEAIKNAVEVENILNCRSLASRRNQYQGIRARLQPLADTAPELLDLLVDSPPQVARWLNFFLCLLRFRLLRELMAELVLPLTQRGITQLSAFDVDEFFARKRQQQDQLNRWQDSTFERVQSNTLRLALDAELLSGPPQGPWQIQRPPLPPVFCQALRSTGRAAFITLIGNEA